VHGHAIVIDVGKSLSKVSLWTPEGVLVERRSRPNSRAAGSGYLALDAVGIEDWLARTLADLGRLAPVEAIVPVAHGAAVALLRNGRLAALPLDYEQPIPAAVRAAYDVQRDPFERSGSPALPAGLNIGAQLHYLDSLDPALLAPGAMILPWAQYWAWRLSGVAAAEVTSLGCHSDLWFPARGCPSDLAVRRGWADLLPPMRRAGDCLGTLTPEWVARTGLSSGVRVHCGIHDSNAALLAARGFPELASRESTVLSTGTWFVAMRTPGVPVDQSALPADRDCLVNVDAAGQPVPSARFMGGREIELLTGSDTPRIDIAADQAVLLDALHTALADGARVLPTFVPGTGPFPRARGRWEHMPADQAGRRASVSLYAALVADVTLDLIGSSERIVVEGRFAQTQVFVRALAALRPGTAVYAANSLNDVSYGALRLLDPSLAPDGDLVLAGPLELDLGAVRAEWLAEAQRMEQAA